MSTPCFTLSHIIVATTIGRNSTKLSSYSVYLLLLRNRVCGATIERTLPLRVRIFQKTRVCERREANNSIESVSSSSYLRVAVLNIVKGGLGSHHPPRSCGAAARIELQIVPSGLRHKDTLLHLLDQAVSQQGGGRAI